MEKKRSKKKLKNWVCPEGCKLLKVPCKHLEGKLPSTARGKQSMELQEEITKVSITEESIIGTEEYEIQARNLAAALTKMGLESFRVGLLMDRFVDKLSLREIAKKEGYLSHMVVYNLINDTLNKLRHLDIQVVKKLLKDYN